MIRGGLREYSEFDSNGELVLSTISKRPPLTKGRWFIVHSKEWLQWLLTSHSLLQVKILMLLASKITFENVAVKITIQAIADKVKASAAKTGDAVRQLIKDGLIRRQRIDGVTAYLVHPKYLSKGGFAAQEATRLWKQWEKPSDNKIHQHIDTDTGEILTEVPPNVT